MSQAGGIADGSVVRLNGYTIGYLDKLRLTDSRDPKRAVEFRMQVNGKYLAEIPVDSVAEITAANLLGDKFINITRGKETRTVNAGDELRSLESQDIPELMAQIARAGKDRLLAFHVCDWLVPTSDILNDRGMMGDGVIDIRSVRHAVEAQGFAGYCEVEIFSNTWWEKPIDEVLQTCITRHRSVV